MELTSGCLDVAVAKQEQQRQNAFSSAPTAASTPVGVGAVPAAGQVSCTGNAAHL